MYVVFRNIVLVILLCPGVGINQISGQIVYTSEFTRSLRGAAIDYAEPVEQWLHVVPLVQDDFMRYSLVLQNQRNDLEIRYRIHAHNQDEEKTPASVEVTRLAARIASNEEFHNITLKVLPDDLLKNAFNAERGVVVTFTPKAQFSEKQYAAFLSLYAHGEAIDIILLYTDPGYDPLTMYRGIRFSDRNTLN